MKDRRKTKSDIIVTICCTRLQRESKTPFLSFSDVKAWLLSLALVAISGNALADTLLNGLASHTEFNKEQYIAGLYLESTSANDSDIVNAPGAKAMRMHITSKRIPSRSFRDNWLQRIAINNPDAVLIEYAPSMAEFAKLIRQRYRQGDQLEFLQNQDGHTVVKLNGLELGKVEKAGFFNVLLRTWVGPVPINSGFRQGILAAGEIDDALLQRYQATAPSEERIARVKAMLERRALAAQPQPQVAAEQANAKVEPPKLAQPEPKQQTTVAKAEPKPAAQKDEPKPQPKPEPKPEPVQVAAILADDELEEEDSSDEDISAESILSRQLYQSKLVKWTFKHVRYPKRAIKRGQEGRVLLQVTLNREGSVEAYNIVEASKYGALNRAAEKAIAQASPFPVVPDAIKEELFVFTLPVTFRLPK